MSPRTFLPLLERLAPVQVDRLSAWVAFSWAIGIYSFDPLRFVWALAPLVRFAPEWVWGTVMLFVAFAQLAGSFFRWTQVRIAGALSAFVVWCFLGLQIGLPNHFESVGWMGFAVLAWSSSCTVANLFKGERRA